MEVQPDVCSRHKFLAHVMTLDHTKADHLKNHSKLRLNRFHSVEKWTKKVTNDINEIPRWLSQHNHLNLDGIIDDINILGLVRFMWEGNNHGEISIHVTMHRFTSQRGDSYGEILMHKTFIKKYYCT